MQDMFLSKFKKLKQKNKVLFNKAMKKSGYSGAEEEAGDEPTKICGSQRRRYIESSINPSGLAAFKH